MLPSWLETSSLQSVRNKCVLLITTMSIIFFFFLRLHLQHMEVSRLGVELELQLPAYVTATATQDLSSTCEVHHSFSNARSKTH